MKKNKDNERNNINNNNNNNNKNKKNNNYIGCKNDGNIINNNGNNNYNMTSKTRTKDGQVKKQQINIETEGRIRIRTYI